MFSLKKIVPLVSLVVLSTYAIASKPLVQGSKVKKVLDWENLSVNNAFVTLEVLKKKSEHFTLQVSGGIFPPGSFNGGGTGSKAILGINNLNDFKLSEFQSLQYSSKSQASYAIASILYLNVIIDLECDGSKIKILTADPEFQSTPISIDEQGFQTYRISSSDAQFRAVGGLYDQNGNEIASPNNPGTGQLASMNSIVAAYPNACLVKTMTGDGGMPKNVETSSLLFVVGSSGTTLFTQSLLKNIQLNDREVMPQH